MISRSHFSKEEPDTGPPNSNSSSILLPGLFYSIRSAFSNPMARTSQNIDFEEAAKDAGDLCEVRLHCPRSLACPPPSPWARTCRVDHSTRRTRRVPGRHSTRRAPGRLPDVRSMPGHPRRGPVAAGVRNAPEAGDPAPAAQVRRGGRACRDALPARVRPAPPPAAKGRLRSSTSGNVSQREAQNAQLSSVFAGQRWPLLEEGPCSS